MSRFDIDRMDRLLPVAPNQCKPQEHTTEYYCMLTSDELKALSRDDRRVWYNRTIER